MQDESAAAKRYATEVQAVRSASMRERDALQAQLEAQKQRVRSLVADGSLSALKVQPLDNSKTRSGLTEGSNECHLLEAVPKARHAPSGGNNWTAAGFYVCSPPKTLFRESAF